MSDVVESRSTPAPSPSAVGAPESARKGFDEGGLRVKVWLMVVACTVWGVVIGAVVIQMSQPMWMALVVGGVLAVMGAMVGGHWIARPIEELTDTLGRATKPDKPVMPRNLPQHRRDEVGVLARAFHRIAMSARQDHREARLLRRTLDDRIAKATKRATTELEKMANRDPLTGLANRRFLDAHLPELVEGCLASSTELSCIVFDLDMFKQVNDELGHAAGDDLIRFVGQLIRGTIRQEDYAVRLGGDEFVVLVPGCHKNQAMAVALNIHKLFANHAKTQYPAVEGLGLSAGVAGLKVDNLKSAGALLEEADQRLYHSKQNGRGRVTH